MKCATNNESLFHIDCVLCFIKDIVLCIVISYSTMYNNAETEKNKSSIFNIILVLFIYYAQLTVQNQLKKKSIFNFVTCM